MKKYIICSKATMATVEIFDSLEEAIAYLENHSLCCLTILK